MFGFRDIKTRERLLREPALTLKRTNEISHAAGSMMSQLKLMHDGPEKNLSSLSQGAESRTSLQQALPTRNIQICSHCCRKNEIQREQYSTFGKISRNCCKLNNFSIKYQSQGGASSIRTVKESWTPSAERVKEIFTLQLSIHNLDDLKFVKIRLKSGSRVRIQVDMGA